MSKESKIPGPTIERLALYSRPLEVLVERGTLLVASDRLAELCGVNPAQIRKDLAYFGGFGVRGVGYDTGELLREIKAILGTDRQWTLCIVGLGNLGSALVQNENFKERGYRFVVAFDSDPNKVGDIVPGGVPIEQADRIGELVKTLAIQIGVITTPPSEAQRVADQLMDAGVKGILNFAPIQIMALECCRVANVDFTLDLENLVYHLAELL